MKDLNQFNTFTPQPFTKPTPKEVVPVSSDKDDKPKGKVVSLMKTYSLYEDRRR